MSNWISVEDEMPNDLDHVDILINYQRRIVDATYTDKKFYVFPPFCSKHWTEVKNKVTHWMLVPEPLK